MRGSRRKVAKPTAKRAKVAKTGTKTKRAAAKPTAKRTHGINRPANRAKTHPKSNTKAKVLKTESKETPDAGAPTRSERRKAQAAKVFTPEEVAMAIENLSGNDAAIGYLKKNVSKRAVDVINSLVSPKTDENLASELDMKINAVRRILNIMQGYGITNYYIAKNVNGWLSFAWYINVDKLPPFFEYINALDSRTPLINKECNDYFICGKCYDQTKLVFTFDAAFEEGFKCSSCGSGLKSLNKEQASALVNSVSSSKQQQE